MRCKGTQLEKKPLSLSTAVYNVFPEHDMVYVLTATKISDKKAFSYRFP
jgi:hypothetical protein